MRVRVDKITEDEGLEINASRGPEWLTNITELVNEDGSGLSGPVNINLKFSKTGSTVQVLGQMDLAFRVDCSRCLVEYRHALIVPIKHTFSPRNIRSGEEFVDEEDVDYSNYQGDEIDLGDVLRGMIALAIPHKWLCKADCLGICPGCGNDMNTETCTCEKATTDPRWDALKKLKLDKN